MRSPLIACMGTPAPLPLRRIATVELRPLLFLSLTCAWLVLCFLLLVLAVPVSSGYGVMVRALIIVAPIAALAVVVGGAGGNRSALVTLLLLMFVMTDLSVRQRAFSDTSLDAQNFVKLSVWGMGLLVALFNVRVLRQALAGTPAMWLLIFAVWCTVTAVYSPIPMYSLAGGIAFVAMVLFAAVVRHHIEDGLLLRAAMVTFGLLGGVALVMYVLVPDRSMAMMEGGSILRLAGPFGSPNNLGRAAAITLLLCAWCLLTKTSGWRSPLVLLSGSGALACLFLSQSRTAGIALLAALIIVLGLRRLSVLFAFFLVVLASALVLSLINTDVSDIAGVVSRTGRAQELTTMTGRTAIWEFVWGEIWKAPILGDGFASTKYTIPLGYRTYWGWTSTSAHNMWLQVWMTTGLIGLLLCCAVFVSQAVYCWRSRDIVSTSLLVFLLIFGLAEPGPAGPAPNVLTVVWALWICGRCAAGHARPAKADRDAHATASIR